MVGYHIGYCADCGNLFQHDSIDEKRCPNCEQKHQERRAELGEWKKKFDEMMEDEWPEDVIFQQK